MNEFDYAQQEPVSVSMCSSCGTTLEKGICPKCSDLVVVDVEANDLGGKTLTVNGNIVADVYNRDVVEPIVACLRTLPKNLF